MKTTTESQLRKVALVLSALVLLQLIWGGMRVLLISDPEPTLPAQASLQVEELRQSARLSEELSRSLAARPLFWQGREMFVPDLGSPKNKGPERAPRNSNIDDVALQGTYSAGEKSGVIITYKDERRRLQPDEVVAGWTFTVLNEEGAIFASGEETKVLALKHAESIPRPKKARKPAPAQDDSKKQNETDNQDETGE